MFTMAWVVCIELAFCYVLEAQVFLCFGIPSWQLAACVIAGGSTAQALQLVASYNFPRISI